jgi:glycosyltransferase involved in cell wall biosynthesis
MTRPRFSVVIPTRERPDTLRSALRTCLEQDYDDYEVVVCDNCSSPATKAVIDHFASPRIVYHRSPTPLCMGDNWNLAYSLTRGQYVTYIGDDDGLMPYAFSQLDALICCHGVKAVRWDYAFYSWPNIAREDLANYLQLCMTRSQQWFEGRPAIRDVMAGRLPATFLPNVYHSLVARETLEDIRGRTGHVFASYCPDTYTSFAVAYLVDRYLSVTVPMSVSGFSRSSNNVASNFMRGKHPNTQRYRAENAASGLELHPWIPDLPSGTSVIADSFLTAKRDLFPDDSSLALNRKFLAELLLEKMPIDDINDWPAAVSEIRRSLSDDAELLVWFDARAKEVEPKVPALDSYRAPVEGVFAGYLHLDTSKYRVDDVASAVNLASKILSYGSKPLEWDAENGHIAGRFQRFIADMRLAITLALRRRWRRESATPA